MIHICIYVPYIIYIYTYILQEAIPQAEAVRDVRDGNGRGALHFAALCGHESACKYLVEELDVAVDLTDDLGNCYIL